MAVAEMAAWAPLIYVSGSLRNGRTAARVSSFRWPPSRYIVVRAICNWCGVISRRFLVVNALFGRISLGVDTPDWGAISAPFWLMIAHRSTSRTTYSRYIVFLSYIGIWHGFKIKGCLYLIYREQQLLDIHSRAMQSAYGQNSFPILLFKKLLPVFLLTFLKVKKIGREKFGFFLFFSMRKLKSVGHAQAFYTLNDCYTVGKIPFWSRATAVHASHG